MRESLCTGAYSFVDLRCWISNCCLALLATIFSAAFVTRLLPAQDSSQDSPTEQVSPTGREEAAWDMVELIELTSKHEVWTPPRTLQLLGEIKRFESEQLDLIDRDGSQRTVLSKTVVRVVPRWRTAEASHAHQLYADGKFDELLQAVPAALKSNLVPWQQRILIGELVQTIEGLGKPRVAGAYFLTLAESKPPPMLYASMPLCWTTREPDQVLREWALKWLEKKDDDAARLLGASWLLFTDEQAAAQQALTQLQASSNAVIAQLAVAQGWRRVPPPQTMADLNRWFEFRDKLLPPLQLGPTEFIADRLQRIGQIELARGEWSRIGSQYGDQPLRAQRALGDAAAQLKRLGRDEEAQRFEAWKKELQKQPQ